ncbi:MAG TPA: cell division ATP-binding protein FtsE [Halalkalibaculum sp.]|nr:cell division ATP-binding protein FtsE [Halalkalibaculum sp.]
MSDNSVIAFNNVTVSYNHRVVLDRIDFSLGNGEFVYLIGQTGAGKSSFLRLIYRDLLPNEGSVQVAGMDVTNLSDKKVPLLRRRLGIVFQDFQLLPDRTVYENVAFALQVTGEKKSYIKQRALEVLGMVGLSHKRKSMPDDLSGGEQQRVVIARALANEPRIMLADEPTGNLDPGASSEIMDLLKQINNRGMAVLMVTHDYDTVKQYPFKTLKLDNGTIKEVKTQNL